MSESTTPRPLSLLTLAVLVVALAGVFLVGRQTRSESAAPDPSIRGVVTSGEGTVTATPDQLQFTATVTNRGDDTATAMARTNAGVRKVVAALKAAGVAAKDIQTTNLSVEPRYDYRGGEDRITGYTSSQELRVLVRKLADGGAVIGKAAGAAGNTVSVQNVGLTLGEKGDLIAKARTEAVADSKKAAVALARAAGRDVDDLVYVEENPQSSDDPEPMASMALDADAAKAADVPISAGSQKVTVTVKVRWSLR